MQYISFLANYNVGIIMLLAIEIQKSFDNSSVHRLLRFQDICFS